jgi:hypothetical protein
MESEKLGFAEPNPERLWLIFAELLMVPRYLVICYFLIVFCLAAFSKRTAYQSLSIISFSLRYSRLLLRFFLTQGSTTWCNRRDTRDAVQYRRRFYTETTHAKKHQAGRQTEAIGPWAASRVTLSSLKNPLLL